MKRLCCEGIFVYKSPVAKARLFTFVHTDVPFQENPLVTQVQSKSYRVKKEIIFCNIYITQDLQLTEKYYCTFQSITKTVFSYKRF